jgi:hypothetical protein
MEVMINGKEKRKTFWRNDNVVRLQMPDERGIWKETTTFRTNKGHVGTLQEARQDKERLSVLVFNFFFSFYYFKTSIVMYFLLCKFEQRIEF